MALPKLNAPTYSLTLPLSKSKINFRPYNLGDEKLLIAASQAREKDPAFFVNNTIKVLQNCISDKDGLIDRLPAVDVEFLLMHLRARSVAETAAVNITNDKTQKKFETEIDLTTFYVAERPKEQYVIALTDTIGLKMREPTFRQKAEHAIKYKANGGASSDVIYELIADSVESIYEGEDVSIIGTDATREELMEFLMGIISQKAALYQYVRNAPALMIDIVTPDGEKLTVSGNKVDFLASASVTSTA